MHAASSVVRRRRHLRAARDDNAMERVGLGHGGRLPRASRLIMIGADVLPTVKRVFCGEEDGREHGCSNVDAHEHSSRSYNNIDLEVDGGCDEEQDKAHVKDVQERTTKQSRAMKLDYYTAQHQRRRQQKQQINDGETNGRPITHVISKIAPTTIKAPGHISSASASAPASTYASASGSKSVAATTCASSIPEPPSTYD